MNEEIKSITEDDLVSELWARDVRFLMGRQTSASPLLPPYHLITLLSQSENARVRLALIPLFLRHPEFFIEADKADKSLSSQLNKLVLHFYYTASVFLQRKYQERLSGIFGTQTQLPDLYSSKLGIVIGENHDKSLENLSKRHQTLSGQFINWLGTYEHAAERLIKHMEKFK